MAWGVRKGILLAATYQPIITRAWYAMVTDSVHTNGFLGYVQGTGKQPSDSQPVTYDSVPNFEDFGLGCFLLAGSEVARLASPDGSTQHAAGRRDRAFGFRGDGCTIGPRAQLQDGLCRWCGAVGRCGGGDGPGGQFCKDFAATFCHKIYQCPPPEGLEGGLAGTSEADCTNGWNQICADPPPSGTTVDINCSGGKHVNQAAKTLCLEQITSATCDAFDDPNFYTNCDQVCVNSTPTGREGRRQRRFRWWWDERRRLERHESPDRDGVLSVGRRRRLQQGFRVRRPDPEGRDLHRDLRFDNHRMQDHLRPRLLRGDDCGELPEL